MQAGARGRVFRIHPRVPGLVVVREQAHVRQPHLHRKQFRLAGSGSCEQPVDALQNLQRLILDVAKLAWVGGDAAEINQASVNGDEAYDRNTAGRLGDAVAFRNWRAARIVCSIPQPDSCRRRPGRAADHCHRQPHRAEAVVEANFGIALLAGVNDELKRGSLRKLRVPALRTSIPVVVVHRQGGYLSQAARTFRSCRTLRQAQRSTCGTNLRRRRRAGWRQRLRRTGRFAARSGTALSAAIC